MKYIALLRGINVGGHARLPMADLRELLSALGHDEITTYLQSGNAVFTSNRADPAELAGEIEREIAARPGLQVRVLIRTPDELAAVVAGNPFESAVATPKQLHVTFLSGQPDSERLAQIDQQAFEPEAFGVGDRVIYLFVPQGLGRSKLATFPWERRLGLTGTSRNWNTVTKLLELAGG